MKTILKFFQRRCPTLSLQAQGNGDTGLDSDYNWHRTVDSLQVVTKSGRQRRFQQGGELIGHKPFSSTRLPSKEKGRHKSRKMSFFSSKTCTVPANCLHLQRSNRREGLKRSSSLLLISRASALRRRSRGTSHPFHPPLTHDQ